MKQGYRYKLASEMELDQIWIKNIDDNPGDGRWVQWKKTAMENHLSGSCKTFVALYGDAPIGEGTLIFSPENDAIGGRLKLADGVGTANINGLRMDHAHGGQGHMSKLVRLMETYAAEKGYRELSIGVEARETLNLAIYLHWGYDSFIFSEVEEGALVLYYRKRI